MKKSLIPFVLTALGMSLAACSIVTPGHSGSSSGSSKASSSSSFDYDTRVYFDTTGTGAIQQSDLVCTYEGTAISSWGGSSMFHNNGPIRVGERSTGGTLSISFAEARYIKRLRVSASTYNTATTSLACSVGEFELSPIEIDSASRKTYEYVTAGAKAPVTQITFSVDPGNRTNIYEIFLNYGEPEDIYPEEVSFGRESYRVAKDKTKRLDYTVGPSYATVVDITFESSDPSIVAVDSKGQVSGVSVGTANITIKARTKTGFVSDVAAVEVYEAADGEIEKTEILKTYHDYADGNVYPIDYTPTQGNAKILVIPVWFTDTSTYIADSKKEAVRKDIEAAYFGTKEETGWHSVKTFYEEESLGALSYTGTVSEWYQESHASSYYGSSNAGGNRTTELVKTVTDWYFNNHDDKRTDYDGDGDGYLDGVMLIYGAPDFQASNRTESSYGNLWAYCYWVQDASVKKKANPGANVYFWASYDFMYGDNANSRTGKASYNCGDTSHCTIDAHTYIHEMGHAFGLDDYYDYGPYGYSPAASFSMQDHNIGGHDAFSTMAFGWADPYIPEDSCEIVLNPFQETRECILLTPEWNAYDSAFDEYLLLELFTPTGLNELDCTYSYRSEDRGPTVPGIRLWHVDARLVYWSANNGGEDPDTDAKGNPLFTANPNAGAGTLQAFTNTCDDEDYGTILGSEYDDFDLLHLIHNSTTKRLHTSDSLSNGSLFGNGSSFDMDAFKKQFPVAGKLDSGVDLGWSFMVSIAGTGSDVQATVTLTKA